MSNGVPNKEFENFIKKFFELIVVDEDPHILSNYLNSNSNPRIAETLAVVASKSNDEINKAILECHQNYCIRTPVESFPYEEIALSFFDEKKEIIENLPIEAKPQLLHALYRIQFHFVDFSTMHSTMRSFFDNQAKIRVANFVNELANQAAVDASKPALEAVEKAILASEDAQKAVTTAKTAAEKAEKAAETAAETAAKNASEKAQTAAEAAKESASRAAWDAIQASKNAKNAAQEEADRLEAHLSQKASETSVTILGIFASIVLTVVAGLFYSSSVLDNINSANIYRLILTAGIVGFVCVNLMAVMFNYIGKFRQRSDERAKTNANDEMSDISDSKNNSTSNSSQASEAAEGENSLDVTESPETTDNSEIEKEKSSDSTNSAKTACASKTKGNLFNTEFFCFIKEKLKEHFFVIMLDVVLLFFMVFALINLPNDAVNPQNSDESGINVNANVNISDEDGDTTTTTTVPNSETSTSGEADSDEPTTDPDTTPPQ